MQAIVETLFDAVYLISVIATGITMIVKSKGNKEYRPVSYTHLDVYKRQPMESAFWKSRRRKPSTGPLDRRCGAFLRDGGCRSSPPIRSSSGPLAAPPTSGASSIMVC